MNTQYQINTFIQLTTQKIKESLSSKRKNIAIVSYYPTYRSNYGNLITELKKDYNVITIVDRILMMILKNPHTLTFTSLGVS